MVLKRNYAKIFSLILILATNIDYMQSQIDYSVENDINAFVHKFYYEGIPYSKANAFGPSVIPELTILLNDTSEKEYWVNIIVTLGFIEHSDAFKPLLNFFDNFKGEVDVFTFKALISIPFAIGCIAGSGDIEAYNFLLNKIKFSSDVMYSWSFNNHNINQIISQKAILALAVSGLNEAQIDLSNLKTLLERGQSSSISEIYLPFIDEGFKIINRINLEGRSSIFNPK
jgi:hypothetical protein